MSTMFYTQVVAYEPPTANKIKPNMLLVKGKITSKFSPGSARSRKLIDIARRMMVRRDALYMIDYYETEIARLNKKIEELSCLK